MKKAIAKQLRQLAKDLPPLMTYAKRRARGDELLSVGYTSTDKVKIFVERYYVANMPTYLNHYDRLKEAYKKHGTAGIGDYMKAVNNLVKEKSLAVTTNSEEVEVDNLNPLNDEKDTIHPSTSTD